MIYGYDFDVVTAGLSNRRDVVYFDEETEGVPDGHTVDSDGNLWVAMNGGGAVVQVNPKTGRIQDNTLVASVKILLWPVGA